MKIYIVIGSGYVDDNSCAERSIMDVFDTKSEAEAYIATVEAIAKDMDAEEYYQDYEYDIEEWELKTKEA